MNLTFFLGAAPDGSILCITTPPQKAPWSFGAAPKSAMNVPTWQDEAHMSGKFGAVQRSAMVGSMTPPGKASYPLT